MNSARGESALHSIQFISLGLKIEKACLSILDQTRLPDEEHWLDVTSPAECAALIQRLAIRGAPLIGVSAALSLGLSARTSSKSQILEDAKLLTSARPTAVNLKYCIDRCLNAYLKSEEVADLAGEALRILLEDVELCERLSNNGKVLFENNDGVLTHCNTGGLATAGIGTALGVLRKVHESGIKIHVYVDETRPLLQGARLTAWELEKLKIPFTLICDSMAASLMKSGKVQKVITGADRIARNGDSANKIGTYSLAVNAHHHEIPFFIAAPRSTFDPNCLDGAQIPIEERDPKEILRISSSKPWQCWNPSFDVTPQKLITKIIFDDGVFAPNEIYQSKAK